MSGLASPAREIGWRCVNGVVLSFADSSVPGVSVQGPSGGRDGCLWVISIERMGIIQRVGILGGVQLGREDVNWSGSRVMRRGDEMWGRERGCCSVRSRCYSARKCILFALIYKRKRKSYPVFFFFFQNQWQWHRVQMIDSQDSSLETVIRWRM